MQDNKHSTIDPKKSQPESTALIERHEIIEDRPIEQILTEDFIARFEKQADLYQKRYLPICLKLTNEADWVNHGDQKTPRYSLQASGAEKVATPLGIVWDRPAVIKHEREDDEGKYYEYEVEGIIHSRVLMRYGWFTGNCSSRDKFFNARGYFDEGDIRKAAFSNWLVNGITRLAGIRNPIMAMLQAAGLKPEEITRVDYSGRRTEEDDQRLISDAQRKRLFAITKDKGVRTEALKAHLSTFGYMSTQDIKRLHYDAIVEWVQKGGPSPAPQPVPTQSGQGGLL